MGSFVPQDGGRRMRGWREGMLLCSGGERGR